MPPRRRIDAGTAAGAMALFLLELTRDAPLRKLEEEFDRSSSSFGNYLNGTQLIPKRLLGALVAARTDEGAERSAMIKRASKLWKAADEERRGARPGPGETPVRVQQRRDDAMQQVLKYQRLAVNAERHLTQLRPMLAYMQSRLDTARLQLQLARDQERTRVEQQITEARQRLERVRAQREGARNRRLTAEEQQEFWMGEVLAAQAELDRLEDDAEDLAVPGAITAVPQAGMDDVDFDARLEHIEAEGLADEAEIDAALPSQPEVLQPEDEAQPDDEPDEVPVAPAAVQGLSNTGLDKLLTSTFVPVEREQSPYSALPDSDVPGVATAFPDWDALIPPPPWHHRVYIRARVAMEGLFGSVVAFGTLFGCLAFLGAFSGFGTAYGAAVVAKPGASGLSLFVYAICAVTVDVVFLAIASYVERRGLGSGGLKTLVIFGIAAQILSVSLVSVALVDQPGPRWLAETIGLL
ncbi:hypothetical protein [Streptomyces sp. Isolate_45]|uniref:hypothetical protein n=1 Tax=Streptomyces sp. Isolate_45 TaxID=2950111 RepID=UPI00248199BB|nr:hypothetical protein [Streptomyces sp. Isolate_45]MDA5283671.1 hypothetical protein [Streptomyces sp. Isolate_45]